MQAKFLTFLRIFCGDESGFVGNFEKSVGCEKWKRREEKKKKKCEKKTCNRGRVRVECARTPLGSKKTECEVSSVVEHILHTDGVISSNLILRISEKPYEIS